LEKIMKRADLRLYAIIALICCAAFAVSPPASADEGMWTFDNPPSRQLKERYNFTLTSEWLDHVRLASLRFNDGGSGSFISPTGLVLTNHHVALGQLQKVSSPQKDYVRDGFHARTQAEEMRSPDLELNQLVSMENVTQRVLGAVLAGMNDQEAFKARKAAIARIEKESTEATGLRSDVVTLYAGAEYWLYRYKKYTDVRLVFAPEQQTAFFGGDPDNFTYPRYDLDMAIFRVYEDGKPVNSHQYLRWNPRGASDGQLVFVSGNPGSTDRMETMAQIKAERDVFLPTDLKLLQGRRRVLERYAEEGPEQSRQATDEIFGIQNSIKALTGEHDGLLDPAVIARKQKQETVFHDLVDRNPKLRKEYGEAWNQIARATRIEMERIKELRFRSLGGARVVSIAVTIVRYVEEVRKPDGERIPGYHDSQLASLLFRLYSPAPLYPKMDAALLTGALQEARAKLGPDDPFVKAALNDSTPAQAADHAIEGTTLLNPAARKALIEGGEAAVAASSDPAIAFARRINPALVQTLKWYEANIESVLTAAGERLGKARFAVYGKTEYPDATFTLRLSYGTVKGYPMNGTQAPPVTTFYGLYDRAYSFSLKPPYNLPKRYLERKDKLDLAVPLNFVSTCDIIGGNSGSPVINRNGELVGLIFDGNIESLVGDYIYEEKTNRAVGVHSMAMIEALRRVYDAGALADEIEQAAPTGNR
jgi:hypothetical protein